MLSCTTTKFLVEKRGLKLDKWAKNFGRLILHTIIDQTVPEKPQYRVDMVFGKILSNLTALEEYTIIELHKLICGHPF